MRGCLVLVMTIGAASAATPSTATVIATASLATGSLLVTSQAKGLHGAAGRLEALVRAGRDPRCFEHGEHRRQMRAARVARARPVGP